MSTEQELQVKIYPEGEGQVFKFSQNGAEVQVTIGNRDKEDCWATGVLIIENLSALMEKALEMAEQQTSENSGREDDLDG